MPYACAKRGTKSHREGEAGMERPMEPPSRTFTPNYLNPPSIILIGCRSVSGIRYKHNLEM